MLRKSKTAALCSHRPLLGALLRPHPLQFPGIHRDAQLKFPENYRNWVYLTSGFDMSYSASSDARPPHVR